MGEFTIKKDTKGYHAYLDITGDYMFTTDNDSKMDKITKALDRQILVMPLLDMEYGYFVCGGCKEKISFLDDYKSHKFCLLCGQRLDWNGYE